MYKLDQKKTEQLEITLQIFTVHRESKGTPKDIFFCFIDYKKAFDSGSQQTAKFLKRQEYQTTLPVSWETCMQVKK